MFVVTLTYDAPLEKVDAVLGDHVAWLDTHYADGTFIASGRRVPRVGGVILAEAKSEEALRDVLAGDPFARAGLARYDITEFVASKARPGIDGLIGI